MAAATVNAQTWKAPYALSTGGEGWESTVAIDPQGYGVSLWLERLTSRGVDQLWSRTRDAAGNWSAQSVVYPPPPTQTLGTSTVLPSVKVSVAGHATAVWMDIDGAWTADKPFGQPWAAPKLLLPGLKAPGGVPAYPPNLSVNARGDALLVWNDGPGPRGEPNFVMFAKRAAGQAAWSAPQPVVTLPHVEYGSVALAANGDALVSWEQSTVTCTTRRCTPSNYELHVSRLPSGASTWSDSGVIDGPDATSHGSRVMSDATGRGGVLYVDRASNTLVSSTQAGTGQSWSTAMPVLPAVNRVVIGAASDAAGHAAAVLLDISSASVTSLIAINGNLSNNTWGTPTLLSGTDLAPNQSLVVFDMASNGAAIVVWTAGDPNTTGPHEIRSALRADAQSAWGAATTVSPRGGVYGGGPNAVSINDQAKAIVVYQSGARRGTVMTEYAVSN